jgi:hypothetical protein
MGAFCNGVGEKTETHNLGATASVRDLVFGVRLNCRDARRMERALSIFAMVRATLV